MKKSEVEGWGGIIGAFLLLGAALIPGYQTLLWLKDGFWTPMPLDLAFRWFDVDAAGHVSAMQWEGAKKICIWIITLPLSVGFLALATAQFYAFEWLWNAVFDDRPASRSEPRT